MNGKSKERRDRQREKERESQRGERERERKEGSESRPTLVNQSSRIAMNYDLQSKLILPVTH